jgi:CspA family cold shock protein
MIGKVLWFDVKKGFGFIRSEDQDIFAHYSKIIADPGEFRTLDQGDTVEFELSFVERASGSAPKPQAKNIKIIEGDRYEVLRKDTDSAIRGHVTST